MREVEGRSGRQVLVLVVPESRGLEFGTVVELVVATVATGPAGSSSLG